MEYGPDHGLLLQQLVQHGSMVVDPMCFQLLVDVGPVELPKLFHGDREAIPLVGAGSPASPGVQRTQDLESLVQIHLQGVKVVRGKTCKSQKVQEHWNHSDPGWAFMLAVHLLDVYRELVKPLLDL